MDSAWPDLPLSLANERSVAERLERDGRIRAEDLRHAETLAETSGRSVLLTLNQTGILSDTVLASALSQATGVRVARLSDLDLNAAPPERMNPEFLRETMSIILSETGPVYAVNPLDDRLIRGLAYALGRVPQFLILEAGDWRRAFAALYDRDIDLTGIGEDESQLEASELADQDRDAPIVRLVAGWLTDAADLGASDIHFDARRSGLEVRYRVDGALRFVTTEPKAVSPSVIARIKVLAGLDLGERNKSQDGRATIVLRGRRLDVRVSIIATIDGESAVIRLLDRPADLLSLERLGYSDAIRTRLEQVSEQRHGLFVVAGPTGSGKTTTMYAMLERLKDSALKILSVEDPVEYHFDHVNQVQISERAGRTFPEALRSFLRHDPDVIFVGEIRDGETARIAVQAALTGHLVLATLHAIDATRVRSRLVDLGVEPFQLDACLIGCMAQRLIRTLCPDCKDAHPILEDEAALFTGAGLATPDRLAQPVGCSTCQGDGYRGRLAVAEILETSESAPDRTSLQTEALKLAASGQTSLAEALGLGA